MYKIEYANKSVLQSLKALRHFDRKQILDRIDEQLTYEPASRTKHRKPIIDLVPPWEHVQPIWELSVGVYRIFYDVDEIGRVVNIRAIRRKPPHKTTEEIL